MTPKIHHDVVKVDGVDVFYRHTGPRDAPAILFLHGFPTSSRQYLRLFEALGDRYRLVAPDYPGFGHTTAPDDFEYSFDNLADVIEGFVDTIGLRRFVLYAFDFGGPVGFRLMTRRPELLAGLVVQNANAYDEGVSELAQGLLDPTAELFEPQTTRFQYEAGAHDATLLDPDSWTVDQHFLELPGRKEAQFALARNYASNIALYPQWQAWLRDHQPPLLVLWGRNDPIFLAAGAHAYRRDVPAAAVHLFDTGHFALQEEAGPAGVLIAEFVDGLPTATGA